MSDTIRTLSCDCGQVRFEAVADPILRGVCYCNDCQAGGRLLEALPGSARCLDDDGGSSILTYRDDRFRCVAGQEHLRGYKLKETSPTQRFTATCCNSPMCLKFKWGHWVSTYRGRFDDADLPPIEMRTNVRCRRSDVPIPEDAPSFQRFPLWLFGKLISSRVAMALGR